METSIERDQLVVMVREIMPVRIHVTPPEENRLWIQLSEPSTVELVANRGLLIHCRVRARLPIFRVLVQIGAPDVAVLLRPRVVSNDDRPRLSFAAEIESFNVRWLPSPVKRAIARQLTRTLRPSTSPLYWEFGQTLTSAFDLPPRFEPIEDLSVVVAGAETEISAERIGFRIWLENDKGPGEPTQEGPG